LAGIGGTRSAAAEAGARGSMMWYSYFYLYLLEVFVKMEHSKIETTRNGKVEKTSAFFRRRL
jgi:hypothetical protein